jgi:DNA repair protein RadD
LNHAPKSYGGAMLSSQVQMEWLDVDDVTYQRWKGKDGKPDTLRVTYSCGMQNISEWLCPDHGGYAASKFFARLALVNGRAQTLAEALDECDDWNKPSRIRVKPEGKFHQIVQLDYKPSEKTIAAQAEKNRLASIIAQFEDDIPF